MDIPDADSVAQSNTNKSNIKTMNYKVSQSVGDRLTDGLSETTNQAERNQVTVVPEIKELEIMFTGITGFALEIKRHLTEMISTGRISRTKTVNTEELLQKMQEIYAENELSVFLKKLESVCMESLKNLKYANARDSYLKSVIAEFTMKYTSEIKTQQHDKTEHSEPVKPLSFREMLKEMQYLDKYYLDSEIFDDEDSYYDYFGDDDEEDMKMMTVLMISCKVFIDILKIN